MLSRRGKPGDHFLIPKHKQKEMCSMAKKEKKNDAIRTEERKINLDCDLTTEEIIERGGGLAAIVQTIRAEEQNLEAEKEAFKERKKEIEDAITSYKVRQSELSEVISTGKENRTIDCEVTFDYKAGRVTVRRLDTGEVFEDREMDDLEKQMQLDFEQDNPPETSAVVECNACGGTGIDSNNCRCEDCRGAGEVEVSVTEPEGEKDE